MGHRLGMLWWMGLVGCAGDGAATTMNPDTTDPDTTPAPSAEELAQTYTDAGPYGVGYRTVEVSWTDPLLTAAAPRVLRVSVWYPTEATSGDDVLYQDVFPADGVLGGAPIVDGVFPVGVFSHGHQAYGEAAGFLMEHLASHGWVVAAPDHLGNLTWDGGNRDTEIYLQRPLDLTAVLDWLDAPEGDPLEGHIGAGRLVMGHSFGGFTVHALGGATWDTDVIAGCDDGTPFCSTMTPALGARLEQGFTDPRVDALVSMASGDYRLFGTGLADIGVPTLHMVGGLDALGEDIWAALDDPDDVRAVYPLLGHNGFTDFAGALDPDGVLDPEVGWASVRAVVLSFANAVVLESTGASSLLYEDSPLESDVVSLSSHQD